MSQLERRRATERPRRPSTSALIYRTLGALVLVASFFLFPLGQLRLPIIAVAAATLAAELYVNHFFPGRSLMQWASEPFFLTVIVVVAVKPVIFAPAMVLASAVLAHVARTVGRRRTAITVLLTAPALTIVAIVAHPPYAFGTLLLFVFGALTVIGLVGESADKEQKMRGRYADLVDGLEIVVWEGSRTQIDTISARIGDLLGDPALAQTPAGFRDRIIAEDLGVLDTHREQSWLGRDHELRYRIRATDGSLRWFLELVNVYRRGLGAVRLTGVIIDVTDHMQTQQRVDQYADLVQSITLGLLIVRLDDHDEDASLRIVTANPAMAQFLANDVSTLPSSLAVTSFPELATCSMLHEIAEVIRTGRPSEVSPKEITVGPRTTRIVRVRTVSLTGGSAAVSVEDITERENAAETLRHQATHDELTGLPNRAYLLNRLATALDEGRMNNESVTLLMLDLDQFKEVNDALGHHHGDRLLIDLGRRLRAQLPEADTIARLGGDEFAIVLTGPILPLKGRLVAERISEIIERPVEVDGITLQSNASVGIACFPDDAFDAHSLIQRADVAMYNAKRSSSRVAEYVPEDDRSSVRRLSLLGELRNAIKHDELENYYQPIVDLRTGMVVGAETLVRWNHPEHGLLQPGEFIELAEVSGLVGPLVNAVAEGAIRDAARWQRDGLRIPVTINLSVRNLYDVTLSATLLRILADHDLTPASLRLEITESALMDDPATATGILAGLRARGTEVSIDDFGTGYSSLSLLRRLPVDELKIDKSFVRDLWQRDATLVRSIVDLAHALGLRVVAEGVETIDTLETLAALGCDRAQGYLLGRPMPTAAFLAFVLAPPDEVAGPLASLRPAAATTAITTNVTALADRRASVSR